MFCEQDNVPMSVLIYPGNIFRKVHMLPCRLKVFVSLFGHTEKDVLVFEWLSEWSPSIIDYRLCVQFISAINKDYKAMQQRLSNVVSNRICLFDHAFYDVRTKR